MSLCATTTGVLRATPGAWACCVMGFDGLPVDFQADPTCPADALAWVTEMSAPLANLRRAAGGGRHDGPQPTTETWAASGGAGAWDDLVMAWGRCHLVAGALGQAYFVALVMGPDGLSGQGRHVLRQHRPALMAALYPASRRPGNRPGA